MVPYGLVLKLLALVLGFTKPPPPMELDLEMDEDDPDLERDEDDPDDDPHCCLGYVDDPAVFLLVLDLLNHPPLEDEDDLEDDLLNHPPPLPKTLTFFY